MMTIYTVYKEPDCETVYYQFKSDAKKAAMDYLEKVADYEGWGVEELRECQRELEITGKCIDIVYIGTVYVR